MSDGQQYTGQVPYEIYRAQLAVAAMTEAAELKMDQTIPGGVYLDAAGKKVDANGVPIKEATPAAEPETGLAALKVDELKALAEKHNVAVPANAKKAEIVDALTAANIGEDE